MKFKNMVYGKAMANVKYLLTKYNKGINISKIQAEISLLRRSIFTSPENDKKSSKSLKRSAASKNSNQGFKIPPGGYFMLIIPVSTFCLGVWQVFRWQWKLRLIDTMEHKVYSDVSEFPHDDYSRLENMEYQKVKLQGYFDYTKELLLGPRSLLKSGDSLPKGLISRGTSSGYHVITPFKLSGTNTKIMVNRGWIPNRNPKQFPSVTHPIEIVGVVRKKENRAPFAGRSYPERGLWLSRDIPKMAEHLGTEEVYLDLHSVPGEGLEEKFPIPGQTRITLRNEHVSYFCTWFSLSSITAYMWHRRFILLKPLL